MALHVCFCPNCFAGTEPPNFVETKHAHTPPHLRDVRLGPESGLLPLGPGGAPMASAVWEPQVRAEGLRVGRADGITSQIRTVHVLLERWRTPKEPEIKDQHQVGIWVCTHWRAVRTRNEGSGIRMRGARAVSSRERAWD
eukprot:616020-Rhodomonas_salina.1